MGESLLSEMSLENSRNTFTAGLLSSLQIGPPKWERDEPCFPNLSDHGAIFLRIICRVPRNTSQNAAVGEETLTRGHGEGTLHLVSSLGQWPGELVGKAKARPGDLRAHSPGGCICPGAQ